MNKIVQRVLYWFFPRRCVLCGDVVAIDDDLCDLCRVNPRIGSAPCDKCGKDKSRCDCKNAHNTPDYERIVAPFYYEGNVIKAVHRFKFSSRPELAKGMGDEMAKTVIREYGGIKFDYITYVPMSEKRQKRRGYNQSLELARRISEKSACRFSMCFIRHTKILRREIRAPVCEEPIYSVPLMYMTV